MSVAADNRRASRDDAANRVESNADSEDAARSVSAGGNRRRSITTTIAAAVSLESIVEWEVKHGETPRADSASVALVWLLRTLGVRVCCVA